MRRRLFSHGLLILITLVGCGGSDDGRSSSVPFSQQVTAAMKEPQLDVRAKKLVHIGHKQAKSGDSPGAETTFQKAAEVCEQIEKPADKASALALLAEALFISGDKSLAARTLNNAEQAAEQIEQPRAIVAAWARLARTRNKLEDRPGAVELLQRAEETVGQVNDVDGGDDPIARAEALGRVAASYKKIDDDDQARRLVAEAIATAESIVELRPRCDAMAALARSLAEMDLDAEADKAFARALELAEQIETDYSRVYAMMGIAEKLSASGRHARAQEVLDQADQVAHKVPQKDLQAQSIEEVRSLMGKLPRG